MKLFRRDPSEKSAFLCFFGGFSLSPSFFLECTVLFWVFFGLGWELGMSRGQFLVVHFLGFCIFGRFWHFLAFFWHFLGFSGGLCIFRILMSYEVTRGIVLVVGRVTDKFWGVQGGFGWVWGGLDGFVLPL